MQIIILNLFFMKKTILFAALAVVAMASCTKNELKVPSTGSDAVISFQPVVANATKAGYLTTDNMKTACPSFGVFAWYPNDGGNMQTSTTVADATLYMNNVKVTYNNTDYDGDEGIGTWAPSTTYYWPKNGKLSFDAYAPADAHAASTPGAGKGTFTSDIKNGLQIADYTVAALENQYDLLYSTRALDKNTSNGGNSGNLTYDGVDIAFNHALAAIEVKAKTAADYGTDVIKLNKVSILYAYNKGKFSQGMTDAMTIGTPKWTDQDNEVDEYVLYDAGATLSAGANLSTTPLTSETSPAISNAILLPQSFDHTSETTHTVSIKVDYSIKGTNGYLAQTQTFKLNTTTVSSAIQNGWEIGKKYTYNFIFTLENIHFAPSVENWTNVTVGDINVQ